MISYSCQITPFYMEAHNFELNSMCHQPIQDIGSFQLAPSIMAAGCLVSSEEEYLNIDQVSVLTGFGRSKIYYLAQENSGYHDESWPLPHCFGQRSSRWKKSEILAWMSSQASR